MSEEGTSTREVDEHTKQFYRNIFTRKILWQNFDTWIDEDPSERRNQFGMVKSAMLLHCGYTTVVMNHINKSPTGRMLTSDPTSEYTNFMNVANETNFVNGDDETPLVNVYSLLSELFTTVPAYREETGTIRDFLRGHLQLLLSGGLSWHELNFSPQLFRSVFWQLCLTFELNKADKPESCRPELMFSSFITAILIAIWHEHDFVIGEKIPGYNCAREVDKFLIMMISSPYFRNLSFFFIVGFWLIVKYRMEGGYVTNSLCRPLPEKCDENDAETFQEQLQSEPQFKTGFDFIADEDDYERVQKEWEVFSIELLKKGLLKAPEGFKIVKKGGRPRKYNKKKPDVLALADQAASMALNPVQRQKPGRRSEKSSPKKKLSRKDSMKDMIPLVLPPPAPPSPPKAVAPVRVIPDPKDVGLEPPVFMKQKEVLSKLKEEMERRRAGGSGTPTLDFKKFIFSSYSEIHRVEKLTRLAPSTKLTEDQKLVQNHWKETYRQPRTNPTEDVSIPVDAGKSHVEAVAPKPSTTSPTKPSRKWKRRY